MFQFTLPLVHESSHMLWRFYVSVLSGKQITFYNSFFILAPTALFGLVGCCLSEGWMNGRMEERWKVNLFSLSNHVPHLRLSNQRLLWKQPFSRVNGSIYRSFTLSSSHWRYSQFFLPSLWGSAWLCPMSYRWKWQCHL